MFSKETNFILLVIVIFIAACIETDIYLPAFPDMMTYFSVSEDTIQSLLTWNFIGICLSGPFYGPISDAVGRKKPLLIALGLFFLGSVITLFAHDFNLMLGGRFLQGIGSGGCFTIGTAIFFDAFKAEKAMEAINKINSIVPFIMAGAPLLGGYLNEMFGFRSNFIAIAFFVFLSLIICTLFFHETLPKAQRIPFKMKNFMADIKRALTCVPFWQLTFVVSLLFAGYLVFLSGVSVLFVLELGVSKGHLPYFQAAILGAWLIASLTFKRSLKEWGVSKTKTIGTTLTVAGVAGLAAGTLISPGSPYLPTAAMMVYAFGVNWAQGIYFPEGMEALPDIKGIAASLLTSARLLLTAVIVGISSMCYNGTIYPIAAIIVSIVAVVLSIVIVYERKQKTSAVIA